ncbi:MAG: hypothetical protein IPO08_22890 [Xanthomonadales bacterium]|nr:hypothetical protein [Xanthomonadales bacterium]
MATTDILINAAIAANGGILSCSVEQYGTLSIQASAAAVAGHNVSFEVSNDGVAWVAILAARTNSGTVAEGASGVLAASPVYGWELCVSAWRLFRIRCTAHTSGSAKWVVCGVEAHVEPVTSTQSAVTISGSPVLGAGTSAVGDVGLLVRSNATGAALIAKVAAAATTNTTNIKNAAGRVVGVSLYNTTAAVLFFKLYNKASTPVLGTDIPVYVIPVPPNGSREVKLPFGASFTTGISYAITGAVSDSDTTVVTANSIIGAVLYA